MIFTKKKKIDSAEWIHSETRSYPLQCDPAIFDKYMLIIREKIRRWTLQEINIAKDLNINFNRTIISEFKKFNVRLLAYPTHQEHLLTSLMDTEISRSGGRWLDCIANIHLFIPVDIAEVIKGKFLYSMIYATPYTQDEDMQYDQKFNPQMPSKELWIKAISNFPWLPYLLVFQDEYDTNEIMKAIETLIESSQPPKTSIAV